MNLPVKFKILAVTAVAVSAFVLGAFALEKLQARGVDRTAEVVILNRVRDLGELHTVAYTYQITTRPTSSAEVRDGLSVVPGVASLVAAATHNEAVVTHVVTVEAGLDLSHAIIATGKDGVVVTLPEPKLYPARISSHVETQKRGLFWTDANLVTRDQRDVSNQSLTWAQRQDITKRAKANAVSKLIQLLDHLVSAKISIQFRQGPIENS